MKNYFKVSLMLFALTFCSTLLSQTYSNNKSAEEMVLEGDEITQDILKSLNIDTSVNPKNAVINGTNLNSIYLQQIGSNNATRIQTNTRSSEVSIFQNGRFNNADLDYTANTVVTNLRQEGDYNKIKDYVNNTSKNADVSLDLTQDGNNLYFERFGTNSITESLKFNQTGNGKSLIIRSFK